MLGTAWGAWGCMGCSWLHGMLPVTWDAPGYNGCSRSRWVLLTPAAPCGEQQARRRELLTAASCSLRLSTSRCAASARCKRAENTSGWAPPTPHPTRGAEESPRTRAHASCSHPLAGCSSTAASPRTGQWVQPGSGELLCRGNQSPSLQGPPVLGSPAGAWLPCAIFRHQHKGHWDFWGALVGTAGGKWGICSALAGNSGGLPAHLVGFFKVRHDHGYFVCPAGRSKRHQLAHGCRPRGEGHQIRGQPKPLYDTGMDTCLRFRERPPRGVLLRSLRAPRHPATHLEAASSSYLHRSSSSSVCVAFSAGRQQKERRWGG